jgi:hypothetical protein
MAIAGKFKEQIDVALITEEVVELDQVGVV